MITAFLRALLPEGEDVLSKSNAPDSVLAIVFDGSRTFGRETKNTKSEGQQEESSLFLIRNNNMFLKMKNR